MRCDARRGGQRRGGLCGRRVCSQNCRFATRLFPPSASSPGFRFRHQRTRPESLRFPSSRMPSLETRKQLRRRPTHVHEPGWVPSAPPGAASRERTSPPLAEPTAPLRRANLTRPLVPGTCSQARSRMTSGPDPSAHLERYPVTLRLRWRFVRRAGAAIRSLQTSNGQGGP